MNTKYLKTAGCHLECKRMLREGEEAEWRRMEKQRYQNQKRERTTLNSQRQCFDSWRAPTCCYGNTTYSEYKRARARWALVCHCGHAHCISQQLVLLQQTSGGRGKDMTLFLWWVASSAVRSQLALLKFSMEPCACVRGYLHSVPLLWMGIAQQQVEAPFKLVICFWINLQQAIRLRA